MIGKAWKTGGIVIAAACVLGSSIFFLNHMDKNANAASQEASTRPVDVSPAILNEVKNDVATIYVGDYYFNRTKQSTNDLPADQVAHGVDQVTDKTILIIDEYGHTFIKAGKTKTE